VRITPLDAPYEPDVAAQLAAMMPPGAAPLALFRTFAKNLPMARAMGTWGRHELSRSLSVGVRERELVIDRTCARCGCEYEWGVHVALFGERAGFTSEQVTSLTHGTDSDRCWTDPRDRLLIRLVDALHDDADVDDGLWRPLAAAFREDQLLDLLMLCGWYHAISFTARVTRQPLEPGTPTFASVNPPSGH
jgi:alkylhydroperoxidase family enzyme